MRVESTNMSNQTSTLTTRVAAIEMKMLYLLHRARKIIKDQKELGTRHGRGNREKIKEGRDGIFNTVDIIITMGYIFDLINEIFQTPELADKLNENIRKLLKNSRKAAARWISIRNKLGGHLDIGAIEDICRKYNFNGVFLSDDLDCDSAVLNMLMIEGAINQSPTLKDIFGREIEMLKDADIFSRRVDEEWRIALEFFRPMLDFLYEVGKDEKKSNTSPSTWKGIVVDD